MGSTELGLGIVLVCVSVAIAAVWGTDRAPPHGSHQHTAHTGAPIVDASAPSLANSSVAP